MLKILQFEQDEALFPRFCIHTKKDKAKKNNLHKSRKFMFSICLCCHFSLLKILGKQDKSIICESLINEIMNLLIILF